MIDPSALAFWIAVGQIIAIDILLSGDNAVVIALACRNLPAAQRRAGIVWGVGAAVGLRVVLTAFAAHILDLPVLKMLGGVVLIWIGIKLLLPEESGSGQEIDGSHHLWGAVRTVVVADFVMSLDNVIAVAAASRGSILLLVFGLLVSIPLIIWSSQLVMHAMERFPIIVSVGAALLGWIAGGMIFGDSYLAEFVKEFWEGTAYLAGLAGAIVVVGIGHWLAARRARRKDYELV